MQLGGDRGEFLVHRAAHRAPVIECGGVRGVASGQVVDQLRHGAHAGRQRQLLLRPADALAQPGEIQDGQRLVRSRACYFDLGVGIVSIVPSDRITVLVPLPFGMTIADPPFGMVMV